jgi:CYTH domain-containing protein
MGQEIERKYLVNHIKWQQIEKPTGVAEIELTSEDENFDIPAWVAQEVTGNEKYYNSNLTIKPYKDWNTKD